MNLARKGLDYVLHGSRLPLSLLSSSSPSLRSIAKGVIKHLCPTAVSRLKRAGACYGIITNERKRGTRERKKRAKVGNGDRGSGLCLLEMRVNSPRVVRRVHTEK